MSIRNDLVLLDIYTNTNHFNFITLKNEMKKNNLYENKMIILPVMVISDTSQEKITGTIIVNPNNVVSIHAMQLSEEKLEIDVNFDFQNGITIVPSSPYIKNIIFYNEPNLNIYNYIVEEISKFGSESIFIFENDKIHDTYFWKHIDLIFTSMKSEDLKDINNIKTSAG